MLKDRHRTQVPDVLKIYYNEIKIQFFTSIHILPTNNALEFLRHDASQFCYSHGILYLLVLTPLNNKMVLLKKMLALTRCPSYSHDSNACT